MSCFFFLKVFLDKDKKKKKIFLFLTRAFKFSVRVKVKVKTEVRNTKQGSSRSMQNDWNTQTLK